MQEVAAAYSRTPQHAAAQGKQKFYAAGVWNPSLAHAADVHQVWWCLDQVWGVKCDQIMNCTVALSGTMNINEAAAFLKQKFYAAGVWNSSLGPNADVHQVWWCLDQVWVVKCDQIMNSTVALSSTMNMMNKWPQQEQEDLMMSSRPLLRKIFV